MAIWNDFPYTDFHAQNMDWILGLLLQLKALIDNGFGSIVNEWIDENYNTLFFNASYNKDTETITFARSEKHE